MYKICVQTIDGDTDYYDLDRRFCFTMYSTLILRTDIIRFVYYPEYRENDLIISLCWVGDE